MRLTSIEKADGPLTKIISLRDGKVFKDASQCYLTRGRADQHEIILSDLPTLLRGLKHNQALVHGVSGHTSINILSERLFSGQPGTVTRTKDYFHFVDGEGSAFFDHDPKLGQPALSREDFIRTLSKVCPAIGSIGHVWTPSTSSCLYHGEQELVGLKAGMHIYFAVKDATDLSRFSEVLFKRLWLAGHGYIFITKDGSQLPRTIFDKAVFSPERLDFCAGALCKDGLEQRLPDPVYVAGDILDTSLLPDLTAEEEKEFRQLVTGAKKATGGEANKIRQQYVKTEVEKLVVSGTPEKKAQTIIEHRLGGDLAGEDLLQFDRLGTVRVADVLANPEKYDRETLRDPLEPECGPHKAIYYANRETGGQPVVFSQAHGGRTFFLHDIPPVIKTHGNFKLGRDGVYYLSENSEGETSEQLICSRLEIAAAVRDKNSEGWGRLLRFKDLDGAVHEWAMPMRLLSGDGTQLRDILLDMGLHIQPGKARGQLSTYLQAFPVKNRALGVDHIGWCDNVFVMPTQVLGEKKENVVFQNEIGIMRHFRQAGTLTDWQQNVASLCSGNSRLIFAVACAFAAPLLYLVDHENGGFNYQGHSSTGKTTVLSVAGSTCGPPSYLQRWRATANGLEALAASHNDALLILDELSQVDPREAGEIAYMLANGSGKVRANRQGGGRPVKSWRLLFLSSGEISLSAHMAEKGKKAKAGQETRLADLPADAGQGMGIFEDTHGAASPAAFARQLKENSAKWHGTAFVHFITSLLRQENFSTVREDVRELVKSGVSQWCPEGAEGQVVRVCERFALVGVAGELATKFGTTGWENGAAINAAHTCFAAWLEARGGTGNLEKRKLIEQVKTFFEGHGESRFSPLNARGDDFRRIINRAGFYDSTSSGTEYFVLPSAFREMCSGFDPKRAAAVLVAEGIMSPGSRGKNSISKKLPGLGQKARCYHFNASAWRDDESE